MASSCIVLHVCVLSALRHLYSCDLCDTVFFLIRFRTHSRQGRALVFVSEENKKSEPFSYREKVRIFMVWCAWRDSNPRHLASEASALSSWATDADLWKIAFQRFSTYEIIGKNRSISNSGQFVVWLPLTTAVLQAQTTVHRTKMAMKYALSQ